jgi:hypothetical protein
MGRKADNAVPAFLRRFCFAGAAQIALDIMRPAWTNWQRGG